MTVEAFASRKAVVTCRDSGGPAELVRDGETGLVCEPDAGRARGRARAPDGRPRRWPSGSGARRAARGRAAR